MSNDKLKKELEQNLNQHSEEVDEIITSTPSWILRRGTTLVFAILGVLIAGSMFIQYPDIVKTTLKVNSLNAPKPVYTKQAGKLIALLAKEGTTVKKGDIISYMESIASHRDVLTLHDELLHMQGKVRESLPIYWIADSVNRNLGDLQPDFQAFIQEYRNYKSSQKDGYYLHRKKILERDLRDIDRLKVQIQQRQSIQKKELANIKSEFEAYQKLYKRNVISQMEFKQQENKYLSANYPLQQSAAELLNNGNLYLSKQKEILELNHTIEDQKAAFLQGLNKMISQTDEWLNTYVLKAPIAGVLSYAGIVQENMNTFSNQELFIINPTNSVFFGEVKIPQYNMGKVAVGQSALVKMKSFPFEQYGMIRGRVRYISDVAVSDSVFFARISLDDFEKKNTVDRINLKNGMLADVEIITQENTLFQRFIQNFFKLLKQR